MSLCEACDKAFHGRGIYKGHKRDYSHTMKRVPSKTRCNEHPGIPLALFCNDDKCFDKANTICCYFHVLSFVLFCLIGFICVLCYTKGSHKGHSVEATESVSARITEKMAPLMPELTSTLSYAQTIIDKLREELQKLTECRVKSQATIHEFVAKGERSISSCEDTLTAKNIALIAGAEAELDRRLDFLHNFLFKADEVLRFKPEEREEACCSAARELEKLVWAQSTAMELIETVDKIKPEEPIESTVFVPRSVSDYAGLHLVEEKYLSGGLSAPTGLKILCVTDFSVLLGWTSVPTIEVALPPLPPPPAIAEAPLQTGESPLLLPQKQQQQQQLKVMYRVEQRQKCGGDGNRDGGDACFSVVSETTGDSVVVSCLAGNTQYEFRVCAVLEQVKSAYTPVLEVRTLEFSAPPKESTVLSGLSPKCVHALYGWCGSSVLSLLYRGSRDGFTAAAFHSACDGKGATLVVIRNASGAVFGGFASAPWYAEGGFTAAPGSFLFSLVNTYGTDPAMFPVADAKCAIQGRRGCGPIFGRSPDLCLVPPFNKHSLSYSCIGSPRHSYTDTLGLGASVFSDDGLGSSFKVAEIEVFEVLK